MSATNPSETRCPVCGRTECRRVVGGLSAKGNTRPCDGSFVDWCKRAWELEDRLAAEVEGGTKDRFVVDRSRMRHDLLSYRQWDDDLGRISATKAKVALSQLLKNAGAKIGDEVEVSVRIMRKAVDSR